MSRYADIAFPTAVRKTFTYSIPDGLRVEPGMRVWVPLRNEKSIGMVVRLHEEKPDFKTKSILRVLDEEPIMGRSALRLADWVHRFYYASPGEVIQAALPAGLNFVSEKRLFATGKSSRESFRGKEREILDEIGDKGLSLKEARKRWKETPYRRLLDSLIKKEVVEIWEEPRQKVSRKTEKHWTWREGIDHQDVLDVIEREKEYKWVSALEILLDVKLPRAHTWLVNLDLVSPYTLRRIEEEGLIEAKQVPLQHNLYRGARFKPESITSLTDLQKELFEKVRRALDKEIYKSFLLHGVTGSGKTEIYIHALKHALAKGKGGLILVPEIALTPQTVRRFYQIFGDEIAVIHSRLSDSERYEEWLSVQTGEKKVVIGPRSAVFAPVKNLGLIVVDEEHDSSYKQFDPSPRYHARDVAVMRASFENAVVLMGSATPSLIAMRGVQEKKHTLLELPARRNSEMPPVKILDMKQYKSAMKGPLTVELYEAVEKALGNREQVILLYNRRGYASCLQCEDCGHIPQSPDCSVSLTYHKQKNILLCHYSGYSRRADKRCESCGSENLTVLGSGTQQIEEDVQELFPDARLLRMDRDTTAGKRAHSEIYETFLGGDADILIGTQLVSKGLDFPNVTVVGVLHAETELAFPSFRSGERMFQLLSQVAGRTGRGDKPGRVFVQTWVPDHRSIRHAKEHNYHAFAAEELEQRESLAYPPFSRMTAFHFKGVSESRTREVAEKFTGAVRRVVPDRAVLGPSPGVIEWMNGKYHWESSIKIHPERNAAAIEKRIDQIFRAYDRVKPKGHASVRIGVDVDRIE